jgi:hypothetical protein
LFSELTPSTKFTSRKPAHQLPPNPAAQGSIVTVFASGGGGLNLLDGEITSTLRTIYYLPGGVLQLPVSVVNNGNTGFGNVSESLQVMYAGQAPGEIAGIDPDQLSVAAGGYVV